MEYLIADAMTQFAIQSCYPDTEKGSSNNNAFCYDIVNRIRIIDNLIIWNIADEETAVAFIADSTEENNWKWWITTLSMQTKEAGLKLFYFFFIYLLG